jgi:hypothetical protein
LDLLDVFLSTNLFQLRLSPPIPCSCSGPTIPLLNHGPRKFWDLRLHRQGRSLACVFTHLFIFSDVGIKAQHIAGEKNVIANYLSHAKDTNELSSLSFKQFQREFLRLTGSHCFQLSRELLCLLPTALFRPSADISTTRVPLGQLQGGPDILK